MKKSLLSASALAVAVLALSVVPACVSLEEPGDEPTAQLEQSLQVSNWSAPQQVSASTVWYAQVATLGNTTYMVHSGPGNGLRWRQLVGSAWTEPVMIPNQTSGQRVSLAAFDGFLYMVRTDLAQNTKLWVSRFTPATGQWSTSFQIPHTSYYPPALAAYNGRLYLIGVTPSDKKLWMASMSTDEVFTPSTPMDGHYSASRVSAAVYNCKLYIAHRAGTGMPVVFNSFDGASWTYDQYIPVGLGGAPLQAAEPVIAERSGYLHLVHRDSAAGGDVPVWWTYFDGATWASEVTLGTATTAYGVSLTQGGAGLVAVLTTSYNSIASSMQFSQSRPIFFPLCSVVLPPPIVLE